jgi:twitching motility protein PilT
MARIDALFKMMKDQGASDLHLSTSSPPIFRLHGELERLNFKALSHEELKAIIYEILSEKQVSDRNTIWTLPIRCRALPGSGETFSCSTRE